MALLFVSGLAVRRAILTAQYEHYGRPLPFSLECALNFRHVRMLVSTGVLPVIDKSVQYPGGVHVRRTYEIGSEYICAVLARLFRQNIPLAERVRWISGLWFCLGIPAVFLWLWWWQRSVFGATLAGAFYALSLASVIRSTGQELSHENFALPLLLAHFAVSALAEREDMRFRTFICLGVVSALLLACALMLWDLIQFYIIIWALLGFIRAVQGEYFQDFRRRLKWSFALAALVLAALLNPYLRAHGFFWSPAMLVAYGTLFAMCSGWFACPQCYARHCRRVIPASLLRRSKASGCEGREAGIQSASTSGRMDSRLHGNDRRRLLPVPPCRPCPKKWGAMLLRIGLALLPLMAGFLLFHEYAQSYHHFAELIYAKIIFFNAKPADPSLLTFAPRILWVPALHSATFSLTKMLFPFSLPLFLVSAIIFLFNPRWRTDPEITGLLFFSFMSLMAFILFVRLHVFAVIGVAASIGLLGAWVVQRRNMCVRVMAAFFLMAGAAAEGANVLRDPLRWGGTQPYLKERLELVDWLKANTPGQPVLANFGISAFVLAYADCPIILHPKFEFTDIRKRTQEYGEMLFKADEGRFRSWANQFGAVFYIYSLGEFTNVHPEAQMRYFVDALNPPPAAPARLFEFKPLAPRWFVFLWGNAKYRVFRIITPADEQTAKNKAAEARLKISHGLLSQAEIEAKHALLYDPGNKNAQEAILRIDVLKRK